MLLLALLLAVPVSAHARPMGLVSQDPQEPTPRRAVPRPVAPAPPASRATAPVPRAGAAPSTNPARKPATPSVSMTPGATPGTTPGMGIVTRYQRGQLQGKRKRTAEPSWVL
ncbi:MAG: hypothetical protein ACKO3S_12060 [bacterium]